MGDYGTPENPYVIPIPGWDDLVKFKPKLIVEEGGLQDKKDVAIFYSYKKKGNLAKAESVLGAEKFAEIYRKDQRIQMLKASPTPEVVQSIGKIMTHIDNTEDLLSTGLVLGRMLLKRSPWLLARVGKKFIPVLGWALLAVDVLEVAGFLWKILFPGKAGKKKGFDILNPTSWKKAGRLKRAAEFMRGKPGVGALLEAAQASETVFGIGLNIGPLMGLAENIYFGSAKAKGGATVTVDYVGQGKAMSEADRVRRGTASAVALMHLEQQKFSSIHMMAMIALALALQLGNELITDEEIIKRSDEGMGWNMAHIKPWSIYTRECLIENGIDPDAPEPWTIPGAPYDLSFSDYAEFLKNSGGDIIEIYRKRWPTGDEAIFVSSTLREILVGCFNCDLPAEQWIEEDIHWELSSEEAFFLETIETGVRPPVEAEYTPPLPADL